MTPKKFYRRPDYDPRILSPCSVGLDILTLQLPHIVAELEMTESLRDRQENELSVLQAIFGQDEVQDLRKGDAWKVLIQHSYLIYPHILHY